MDIPVSDTVALTPTENLVRLINEGYLVAQENGTITIVKSGKTYPLRRGNSIYAVFGATCPITGARYTANLHRVIWIYFKGAIPDGMQVNHRNGDKWDNSIDNLELATPSQNSRHALSEGLSTQKLGFVRAEDLRGLFILGETKYKLSKQFDIDVNMVSRVLKNDSYVSETEVARLAAAAHGERYPVKNKPTGASKAQVMLEQLVALHGSGAFACEPVAGLFQSGLLNISLQGATPTADSPYPHVWLKTHDGVPLRAAAHRLMWAIHYGMPEVGKVIHHRNADTSDFSLSNLEQTTTRLNALYSAADSAQAHAKVGADLALQIRTEFWVERCSANALAVRHQLSQRVIRNILTDEVHRYGEDSYRVSVKDAYLEKTAKFYANRTRHREAGVAA